MKKNIKNLTPATASPGVLIVAPGIVTAQGGVNGVINHLVDEMARDGTYHPVLLEKEWRFTRPVWRTANPCTTVTMRLRGPTNGGWGRRELVGNLAFLFTLPLALYRLRKLIRDNGIRYINIQYPGPQMAVFVLLKRLGLFQGPILVSVHNSDVTTGLKLTGLKSRVWQRVLQDADAIVAVSRQLGQDLSDRLPWLNRKIHVAYNGVDTDFFACDDATRAEKPDTVTTLLCVASFDRKKGLDVLLHAFSRLLESTPGLRLLIVGQAGAEQDTLIALTSQLNLDDHVQWHCGFSYAEIAKTLALADLFVLPSRNEGFPLALLEAGAAGLPVIATRVGGIPELIGHQETGLLIPPDDVGSLTKTLRYALDNPEITANLGKKLHQLVVTEFSWHSTYRRYAAILRASDSKSC